MRYSRRASSNSPTPIPLLDGSYAKRRVRKSSACKRLSRSHQLEPQFSLSGGQPLDFLPPAIMVDATVFGGMASDWPHGLRQMQDLSVDTVDLINNLLSVQRAASRACSRMSLTRLGAESTSHFRWSRRAVGHEDGLRCSGEPTARVTYWLIRCHADHRHHAASISLTARWSERVQRASSLSLGSQTNTDSSRCVAIGVCVRPRGPAGPFPQAGRPVGVSVVSP